MKLAPPELNYLCKHLSYGPICEDDEVVPRMKSVYKWDMRFL